VVDILLLQLLDCFLDFNTVAEISNLAFSFLVYCTQHFGFVHYLYMYVCTGGFKKVSHQIKLNLKNKAKCEICTANENTVLGSTDRYALLDERPRVKVIEQFIIFCSGVKFLGRFSDFCSSFKMCLPTKHSQDGAARFPVR